MRSDTLESVHARFEPETLRSLHKLIFPVRSLDFTSRVRQEWKQKIHHTLFPRDRKPRVTLVEQSHTGMPHTVHFGEHETKPREVEQIMYLLARTL